MIPILRYRILQANKRVILILFAIIAIGFMSGCALGLLLDTNPLAKVKLSKNEKKVVNELEEKCNCKVFLRHDFFLVTGKIENNQYMRSDSTCELFFEWDKTKKNYDGHSDLCHRDSLYLRNYVDTFLPNLLNVLAYQQYYRGIRVYFRTRDYYTYDGKIITNSNNDPMMDYKCEQHLFFSLKRKKLINLGR